MGEEGDRREGGEGGREKAQECTRPATTAFNVIVDYVISIPRAGDRPHTRVHTCVRKRARGGRLYYVR